jgi:hypothetical protein
MRIDGEWLVGDDGISRPVIRGEMLAADGSWVRVPFLLDTGADRTVLSAAVLRLLGLRDGEDPDRIGGVGGIVSSDTSGPTAPVEVLRQKPGASALESGTLPVAGSRGRSR